MTDPLTASLDSVQGCKPPDQNRAAVVEQAATAPRLARCAAQSTGWTS